MGVLNVLECTKCNTVIVVLVSHVDEWVSECRAIWYLFLESILNLRVIVKNRLVSSMVILGRFLVHLIVVVLPIVRRSIALVNWLVFIALRFKLLIIWILIDELGDRLVELRRLVALFIYHVTQLRRQLNLLLVLQIEFRSYSVYLLVSESQLLRGLNLHTVNAETLFAFVIV